MNIGATLARNARRIPDKIAIHFREKSYTYDRLNREVNRLAHGLIAEGVRKGDKVALMMKNSDLYMVVFYAIMKVGAVAVPVNFRLTSKEVGYILDNSDTSVVFFDDEYAEIIKNATDGNDTILSSISVGSQALTGHKNIDEVMTNNESEPAVDVKESDDAEILYTSGTTGLPKGAVFDHHRVLHVALNVSIVLKMNPEDTLLHIAPLFHSAQLNLFMISGTYLGCTQVIQESFDPEETFKAIERHKISLFFAVPTMYNFLLQVPDKEKYDLSSVQRCGYGAAPMPVALLEKAMNLFGTDQFYNMCGLTEGGPGGIILLPSEHKEKLGAGGKAMLNTEVRVISDSGEDIQPGEVGEMIIRGETVMKGYYKKPEETKKALRDCWLYTGDLATIDEDGYITLVDRKKDMIISGGENVYSTEVEQVLYKHPELLEAAVIGLPDEVWGEKVAAVVVPKPGAQLDHEEIKSFCRKELAGYKVPRTIFEYKEIPRNASGKILKYKLREELKAAKS
ncbi:acyl-CoA synthetase [Marinithermofilum abyssi]|uniref:Acyl-CoA synthetase n=1 Tax=Marinithermofilum abyssi TaxID=1571185 RepID=A0A8J2YEB1_9BACL|nr:long-chain fatty acid--CoA ligase [Marinithermofilum abyssi]GGE20298.1 acyl-CoA synthetase [Marinithermofilum abyssi]